MKKNQAIDKTKIIIRTFSMITVRYTSVNRARAVVHELNIEARVQARTSQAPELYESGFIPGFSLDWLNDARRLADNGPDGRTCSTNLIDERLRSRTKKKVYIVIMNIV